MTVNKNKEPKGDKTKIFNRVIERELKTKVSNHRPPPVTAVSQHLSNNTSFTEVGGKHEIFADLARIRAALVEEVDDRDILLNSDNTSLHLCNYGNTALRSFSGSESSLDDSGISESPPTVRNG